MSGVHYWCANCGKYKKIKKEECEKCGETAVETEDDDWDGRRDADDDEDSPDYEPDNEFKFLQE